MGEILATTTWAEQALRFGAYRWLVDPTDDSLVGFQYDPGKVMRMSLDSGRVLRTFRIPYGLVLPAIDGEGRIHLVCHSVVVGSCFDIAGPGAVIVYDRTGKQLASRTLLTESDCAFAAPAFLARTTGGGIRALSTGFGRHKDESRCARSPIRAVDITSGLRPGQGWVIPYEKSYFRNYLSDIDIRDMAGTPDGRTLLLEVAKRRGRPIGRRVDGILLFRHRLREIGPDGRVVRSWGFGGSEPGVDEPIEVEVAADGTIWVLDSDPVAREAHTRYLPPDASP